MLSTVLLCAICTCACPVVIPGHSIFPIITKSPKSDSDIFSTGIPRREQYSRTFVEEKKEIY